MTIRALIFDLGKVFVDFSIDQACEQVATVASTSAAQVKAFLYDDGWEHRFESGEFDSAHLCKALGAKVQCDIPLAELEHACANIFSPMHDTISIIKQLRASANVPLILLSNTNHVHWDFICAKFGIHEYFDAHVLSFRERAMKPDAKIYRAAVAAAGCSAQECFFTDDILANVQGAIDFGIDAMQFVSSEQLVRDLNQRGIKVR